MNRKTKIILFISISVLLITAVFLTTYFVIRNNKVGNSFDIDKRIKDSIIKQYKDSILKIELDSISRLDSLLKTKEADTLKEEPKEENETEKELENKVKINEGHREHTGPNYGYMSDKRDGQRYKIISIGKQLWMAENLNFKTKGGSWCYKLKPGNCNKYGQLYNWEIAKNVCPRAWHLPTDKEWKTLVTYLGGNKAAYKKMRHNSSSWKSSSVESNNSSGFSALAGGYRFINGTYFNISYGALYWSASEKTDSTAWSRLLYYSKTKVQRSSKTKKTTAFSVMCIKN